MNIKLWPHGWGGLSSTTSPFNLHNQSKAQFHQWKEEALQACFSNMFSYHEGWALLCLAQQPAADTWGQMQNSNRGCCDCTLVHFIKEPLNLFLYWLEKEWEGGAACCPCQLMSALPAKNVEQGEKYALWSQGPLIDKTGSHWFWVFAFFLCSSNREHWNSLLKLQGFHTSKSGLSLCVSVINWIENTN